MKYLVYKLRKLVKLILTWDIEKLWLKYIYKNMYFSYILRQDAFQRLHTFLLKTSFIKLRRRCFITATPYYIFKHLKISRRALYFIVRTSGWCGLKTSSW